MVHTPMRLGPVVGIAAGLMLTVGVARAAVMGGAKSLPYAEAVAKSRVASQAVLGRTGTEHCLIGKLTNAMLGLSASCETAGERNPLCATADKVRPRPQPVGP